MQFYTNWKETLAALYINYPYILHCTHNFFYKVQKQAPSRSSTQKVAEKNPVPDQLWKVYKLLKVNVRNFKK